MLENVFYPRVLLSKQEISRGIPNAQQQQRHFSPTAKLQEKHLINIAAQLLCLVGLLEKTIDITDTEYKTLTSSRHKMWSKATHLSLGEQQCLSIARLLFHYICLTTPPHEHSSLTGTTTWTRSTIQKETTTKNACQTPNIVVLLDEVTSAMDEECEAHIYGLLQRFIPSYISVGHRSTVRLFHRSELRLAKQDPSAWKLCKL